MLSMDAPVGSLPTVHPTFETVRLAYGSLLRLCLHSAVYYGGHGFIAEKLRGKRGAMEESERDAMRYVLSMSTEIGLSLLICPVRYMAAMNTPRFVLDYMLTSWSEVLSMVDRFSPGRFASYAVYAFSDNGPRDSDYSMDFFALQVPSIVLTLGKLVLRGRRVGAARCRTKSVLGFLAAQVALRALMASFSVMIPETGGEVLEAILVTLLEGLSTSYLVRHTWPFPYDDVTADVATQGTSTSAQSEGQSGTSGSNSCSANPTLEAANTNPEKVDDPNILD